MRLVLLRHARTATNAAARLQGRIDSPLDDVGVLQAKQAGEDLRARYGVDRVVSSGLLRCRQTVEATGLDGIPLTIDDRWQEIDYGTYDDRPVIDVVSELWGAWHDDADYVPPSGESLAALCVRVSEACGQLFEHAGDDETVVVVTHATPIKAAVVWAIGGTPRMTLSMRVSPASLSVVESGPVGPILTAFNLHGPDPR